MRWIRHVVRMDDVQLPKCTMYSQLVSGKRSKGGQQKRFNDSINIVVKNMGVDNKWEVLAENRTDWSKIIYL